MKYAVDAIGTGIKDEHGKLVLIAVDEDKEKATALASEVIRALELRRFYLEAVKNDQTETN
jgi:hypothetical protein